MNYINGRVVIGAPMSESRFRNADKICWLCLTKIPKKLIGLHDSFSLFMDKEYTTCYVCETPNIRVYSKE